MTDGLTTLVLGLGNLLMGDEGIGVHIVQDLGRRNLPRASPVSMAEPGASSCSNLSSPRSAFC